MESSLLRFATELLLQRGACSAAAVAGPNPHTLLGKHTARPTFVRASLASAAPNLAAQAAIRAIFSIPCVTVTGERRPAVDRLKPRVISPGKERGPPGRS